MPRLVKRLVEAVKGARARRRARRTPSGLGYAFADSIAFVEPGAWDRATQGASVFLSRAYLGALESAAPENVRLRYAVAYRGREPVAAVAAQLAALTAERLVPVATPGGALAKLKAKALRETAARVLVCGNLMSWGCHGAAFAPGVEPAWAGVAEGLERIRRAEHLGGDPAALVVKDLTDDVPGADALRTHSYRPVETEPNMVLDLHPSWRLYDDYLAALTSDYRRTAKKVARDVEEAGARVELLADVGAHADRLHALYLEVQRNASVRPVTLPPAYFPALAAALGDRFRCLAIRRGDAILGYATVLRDGDTSVFYYLGFDHEAARELPIYLRLLHALVEDAIAAGCRRISMGRTALDPKARLGARPQPMRVWLRHANPVVNLLVRALAGAVPHAAPPERNPFK